MSQPSATSTRDRFNRIAARLTGAAGSPLALLLAVLLIVIWALSGPIFNFSETWQLVINTGTTIITFLMVFVIQASQNRDSKALHLKLDEVIRALEGARNELITAESSPEDELREKEAEFLKIAEEGAESVADEAHPKAGPEHLRQHAAHDREVRTAAREAAKREVRGRPTTRTRTSKANRSTTRR